MSLGWRSCSGAWTRAPGIEVVDEFYDPAVSGGDPVESRPGFIAMLKRIEGNGVRAIIVETGSRFARDLMVQEVGYAMLTERGIELIAADSPQSFIEEYPDGAAHSAGPRRRFRVRQSHDGSEAQRGSGSQAQGGCDSNPEGSRGSRRWLKFSRPRACPPRHQAARRRPHGFHKGVDKPGPWKTTTETSPGGAPSRSVPPASPSSKAAPSAGCGSGASNLGG